MAKTTPSLMIRYIMLAILIWGTMHAIGIFAYSERTDFRKPFVVYASVLGFLGFWAMMLRHRERALMVKEPVSKEPKGNR